MGPKLSAAEGGALALLRWLPSSLLSRWAGKLAGLRLPARLREPVFRLFGRTVGVDFEEVRDPLSSFHSVQEFFTRALRPGVREVDPGPGVVVAPCDGAWGASGCVEGGTLLQVKGRSYRLAEMLADQTLATHFEGGSYATFYLSPGTITAFTPPAIFGSGGRFICRVHSGPSTQSESRASTDSLPETSVWWHTPFSVPMMSIRENPIFV